MLLCVRVPVGVREPLAQMLLHPSVVLCLARQNAFALLGAVAVVVAAHGPGLRLEVSPNKACAWYAAPVLFRCCKF